MPNRDNFSRSQPFGSLNEIITGNGATRATIGFDTQGFDGGVFFATQVVVFTDGTYTLTVFEDDAANGAGATLVPNSKIIGDPAAAVVSAIIAENGVLPGLGVHSTKRYLFVEITAAGVTTGAQLVVTAVGTPNLTPHAGAETP